MSDVKIDCTKDDVIILDITFLLSGKTFKESEKILFNTIEFMKKTYSLDMDEKKYKNLRQQMVKDATD
ncbi:hypothetical protein [Wenyingzhuangia sp. 2_MG-2023]|uniref:hypothetical protein n=1 Tax=Wenyingzhuangia sp. 2_MG-2023 TaxID=3062639 RepID=UPI0026E3AF9F|nr:hypothetical protein [Wenyingzhuangia sp. 2_MG-2023]MDO6739381.1 hypothetical protein [Wenyingzhuangia sp. 2_MG-2023]